AIPIQLSLASRHLRQRQSASGVRNALRVTEVGDAETGGEILHGFRHLRGATSGEEFVQPHAAGRRFGVELEAAPIELQIKIVEQSDQAASLRDVAKRSDE